MPVVLLNSRIVGDPEVGQKRASGTFASVLGFYQKNQNGNIIIFSPQFP
jgi:hypothetical protein